MNKEICEIIEYVSENYKEDYEEIISVLSNVKTKIQNAIGMSAQNGDYKSISILNEWLEKFSVIDVSNTDIVSLSQNEINTEICRIENSCKLSVNEVWANNSPIGMELQGIYYSHFSWKDILGRVYKILHDKDPVKFKGVVDNNVLHGRKHSSLADKKLNKEYEAITSTGYYYKATPMSAEQARSYIKKILEVYKINTDEFSVSVKYGRKKRNNNNAMCTDDTVYIMEKSKRCPLCSSPLESTAKTYLIYEDENKVGEPKTEKAYIKRCSSCMKDFMTKDTFLTLQKQKLNFEKRIDFKISK